MHRIDPANIPGLGRRYTFHSHTQFCDGRAAMADFAKSAVDAGFTHYGFSPHSPVPLDSPCNMSKADVAVYLAEVDRLREIYGNRINLYAGMEIDYLGSDWGPAIPYFTDMALDYTIASVHFIPDQKGNMVDIDGRFENFVKKMDAYFHRDIDYVVNTFFDQSEAMVDAGKFEIIGHYDKVGHNASLYCPGIEDTQRYRDRLDRLTAMIIERGITVEINTKAWAEHHRIFPSERCLAPLIDGGVKILVNSDAHYPHLIDASRDYAFSLLDNLTV